MSGVRTEIILIAAGLMAWVAIFMASAQGLLHVGGMVSDGVLAILAAAIGYCLWRVWRRRGQYGD
jgi:hypothetical protein